MSSKWNKISFKKPNTNFFNRQNGKLKMAAIGALLISTVSFNLAFAKETDHTNTFNKIYHVYVANNYIGAVADEAAIQEVVAQKEQEVSIQYKGFAVDAGASVKIVPEQVFQVDTKDAETIEQLKEVIIVKAEAQAIQVNGKVIAYVKDEADFDATVDTLKLQYISQRDLDKLNASPSSEQLPPLKENETRIVEITLSGDLTSGEAQVLPTSIVTVDEAVKILKTGSLEQELYTVKSGDVLGSIANAHGLKTAELLALNPSISESSILNIGQQLNITVEKPHISVKVVQEKVKVETIDFAKVVEEDSTMLKGEKVVKQEGTYGKKEVSYLITEENGVRTERAQTSENIIAEPENRIVVVGTKVIPSRGTGIFAWPTVGGYISSQMGHRWGRTHEGIDIARPSDYTIKASDNGVVKTAGRHATYGNYIVINHNNGFETLYAHLSEIDVLVGQVVAQGSAIGIMGSTGRSTGTHLHLEIYKNGHVVNPLTYLN